MEDEIDITLEQFRSQYADDGGNPLYVSTILSSFIAVKHNTNTRHPTIVAAP
jgi:hypothetical protein